MNELLHIGDWVVILGQPGGLFDELLKKDHLRVGMVGKIIGIDIESDGCYLHLNPEFEYNRHHDVWFSRVNNMTLSKIPASKLGTISECSKREKDNLDIIRGIV